MKTSRFFLYVFLVILAFGAGIGIAIWQQEGNVPQIGDVKNDESTIKAQDSVAVEMAENILTGQDIPSLESGSVIPGAADLPSPPSPPPLEATQETSSAEKSSRMMEKLVKSYHEDLGGDPVTAEDKNTKALSAKNIKGPNPMSGVRNGGAFELVDHNGKTVTHQSWPGKHLLVFFGFTHCPDICPAALERITAVFEGNERWLNQVQPLFVTVDPARDTPAVMKDYLTDYHPAIVGLSGNDDQIDAVIDTYRVYAAKDDSPGDDPEVYNMNHTAFLYVVAPDFQSVKMVKSDMSADAIVEKLKSVIMLEE